MENESNAGMVVLVNNRSPEYIMVACSILEGSGISYVPIPGGGDARLPVGLMVGAEDYERAVDLIEGAGEDEQAPPATAPMNQKTLVFFIIVALVLYVVFRRVLG